MAYFPDEPTRFVGRAEAMAKASAALAPGSGKTGVLLHGMAGAGKTACALELAYRHQDAFAAVAFWQAPTRDEEWASALPNFANRLDIQLGDYGFTMAGHIGTVAALDAFLPRLRALMADAGVLLVLDNLETLLTTDGGWRDPRWEKLITALISHDGESRVILTSRTAPAGLAVSRVVTVPMHALSLGESVVLARELPNLRALLHADTGPVRAHDAEADTVTAEAEAETNAVTAAGADAGAMSEAEVAAAAEAVAEADRGRVRRVLRVMQGHPKLMELADAAAADRDRLDAQLAAAEAAAGDTVAGEGAGVGPGRGLDAFFRDGASTLEPGQFLDSLRGWTAGALGALPAGARLMAEFVVCLEDDHRVSYVIDATWADLWRRLGRAGNPPAPGPLLDILTSAALVEAEPIVVSGAGGHAAGGDQPGAGSGVAGAGPDPVAYRIHPGVAAAIIAAAEPGIRDAADAELAAFWTTVAGQAREREGGEDSGEAERLTRTALAAAAGTGDYRTASAAASDLVTLLRDAGRLAAALAAAGQAADYTQQAGLGPWTQLLGQGRRLRVLGMMGEHARVLAEMAGLRAEMDGLPDRRAASDLVDPWYVREAILSTGHFSALATGDWRQCLDLNAEITASQRQRAAGEHEVTRTRFIDAAPLINLGRMGEAGRLLAECQRVFEDHADTTVLAIVLSTRASLEGTLGHPRAAADLGRAALRLSYTRPEPRDIATGHHNLANRLGRLGGDRAGQRAHRLGAAVIWRLAGMAHDLVGTVRVLAVELREDDADAGLPGTVEQVTVTAEQTEGVRLGDLLAALEPDPRAVEDALTEILRAAAAPSAGDS